MTKIGPVYPELDAAFNEFIEKSYENMNLMQDIISKQAQQMSRQREEKIIKILNDKGYDIDINKRIELEHFAKTRCELRIFEDSEMEVIYVDRKPVCGWSTKTDCKFEGDKVVMIMGDVTPF